MQLRRRVIIESPFAGNIALNKAYAYEAALDSLKRGEAPFGSHLLYPLFLDDNKPEQRQMGIESGYAWWSSAELIAFYIDLGWSPGMLKAKERLFEKNLIIPFTERNIR
jgi:hypothetical protein